MLFRRIFCLAFQSTRRPEWSNCRDSFGSSRQGDQNTDWWSVLSYSHERAQTESELSAGSHNICDKFNLPARREPIGCSYLRHTTLRQDNVDSWGFKSSLESSLQPVLAGESTASRGLASRRTLARSALSCWQPSLGGLTSMARSPTQQST